MATVLESVAVDEYRSATPVLSFDDAEELAEEHGSPLLVLSRSALTQNYQSLKSSLPQVEFFYAAKANPAHEILETLCELGSSVDVCSEREALAALRAGFRPDQMIHTHPCKTVSNLTQCHKLGLRWFTFDSPHELTKLAEHTPDAQLLLRVAISASSSLIDLSSKFGAMTKDAVPLIRRAKQLGLAVRGISFHVGSQCLCPDDFRKALHVARRIWNQAAKAGFELEVVDFGGGLPAPYRESVLNLELYLKSLSHGLAETFSDVPVRFFAEPGRGLCADAVTLVTRVIGKSVRGGRIPWYIIDDGLYGSFSGKVFDHADYTLLARNAGRRRIGACVVAGPTCDSSDVVSREQYLPDLEIGELLLVPTMGAYTSASACPFNGLDVARFVAVD